jgi:hypothetical protein
VLVNRLTELVAWTEGFARLAGPAGLLDGQPPSLARFVFTDGRARAVFPEWTVVADDCVARLKQGPFRADAFVAALVDELAVVAGEDFTGRLERVPGLPRAHGILRFGERRFAYETLELPADDDLKLIAYLPAESPPVAASALPTASASNEATARIPAAFG